MRKILLVAIICFSSIKTLSSQNIEYSTPILKIQKLEENLFIHTSYLEIENYGSFPSNGMIYFNENEAIIFDTPVNDSASEELINWIQNKKQKNIKAVVINHFHIDCLGGLNEFNERNIDTYASKLTHQLAKENQVQSLPSTLFDKKLKLDIGNETTITEFFGPGHTDDNLVSYIPKKNVLFGGCLIKELSAKKGNLKDANVNKWSETVQTIKERFPDVEYIVPGHGKFGGAELLDYTIQLFEQS